MNDETNVLELPVPIRKRPAALAPLPVAGSSLCQSTFAMVLAGGRGERLHPLTEACAKPALPFAGALRIVDFALSNCRHSGIRQIALLTQHQAQSLSEHVARGWGRPVEGVAGVDMVPPQRHLGPGGYRGTADAVYQNLDRIRASGTQFVLVLASDHVYKMDFRRFLAEHLERKADVSVACIKVPLEQASSFGIVQVDATGRIRSFAEKPTNPPPSSGCTDSVLASMGIYVFGTDFLCRVLAQDAANPASRHDFGYDILPASLSDARVMAHDFSASHSDAGAMPAYWRDVGTPDAYWQANMDFVRANPPFDLHDAHWPILGAPSTCAGARIVPDAHGQHGSAIDSILSAGCVVQGAVVRRSLLFPDTRVGSGSLVTDTLLLPGARVGRGVRLRRAIVGPGCVIPDGSRIGDCAGADRRHFTVTPLGVTLATAQMLDLASA